jgi:hypothetical protein
MPKGVELRRVWSCKDRRREFRAMARLLLLWQLPSFCGPSLPGRVSCNIHESTKCSERPFQQVQPNSVGSLLTIATTLYPSQTASNGNLPPMTPTRQSGPRPPDSAIGPSVSTEGSHDETIQNNNDTTPSKSRRLPDIYPFNAKAFHETKAGLVCRTCGRLFTEVSSIQGHYEQHLLDGRFTPYFCVICNDLMGRFPSAAELATHQYNLTLKAQ